MNSILKIYDYFLDLFFPTQCVNCGKYGELLCFECVGTIDYVKTSVCLACGKITENGQYCSKCRKNRFAKGVLVAASYDCGPIKEMLHNFKYSGLTGLGELLAEILAVRIKGAGIKKLSEYVVVPVPLFFKRERERGYNQSEIIARILSDRLGLSGGLALARTKDTKTQVGLSRSERSRNVSGAFECVDVEFVLGKKILLVDDVVTTGSTIEECARVLKLAGAKEVLGAVVAKRI